MRSRNAEQFCTGIVSSAENLWLVSRRDNDDLEHPADSIRLGDSGRSQVEPGGLLWPGVSRASRSTSRLLRLEQNGQFREVAWLDDILCLTASPDGRTLFALTGLDRAPGASTSQGQVLRSDDQGTSWKAVDGAFMDPQETVAWSIRLHFHGDNELWSVAEPFTDHWPSLEPPSIGLAYSSDRGHSASLLRHDGLLLHNLEEIRSLAPDDANWGDVNGEHGLIESQFVQLDADNALYWVSQSFMYGPPEGRYVDTTLNFSNRIHLQRRDGAWQIASQQRTSGERLSHLQRSPSGKIIGVLLDNNWQQRIVELDQQTLQWRTLGAPPNLFAPFPGTSGIDDLWVGTNSLLITAGSEHQIPVWLTPSREEPATIDAKGVFYSTDWGRSWTRLNIPAYLGLVGFNAARDRLYWAEGNWYESKDSNIYQMELR